MSSQHKYVSNVNLYVVKGVISLTPCIYGYTVCLGQHLWGLGWGALGSKVLIICLDFLILPLLRLLLSI